MRPNWKSTLKRLSSYPVDVHRILPPCPEARLQSVQLELGTMPDDLIDMLRHFNGAKLFNKCGPMISVFGITAVPLLPPMEWSPDWHIDQYTPDWRRASAGREKEWAIAMTNYGGLAILDKSGAVKEWDKGYRMWGVTDQDLGSWMDRILREGDAFLQEE
jgi:hypothetical protein